MSKQSSDVLFAVAILGFALAASGLVLSVPPLFGPHRPGQVWVTITFGAVALILAATMIRLRLTRDRHG